MTDTGKKVVIFNGKMNAPYLEIFDPDSNEESLTNMVNKLKEEGVVYRVVDEASLPLQDKDFQTAWKMVEDGIEIDMEKCREMTRFKFRKLRSAEFVKLDLEFMKAMENADMDRVREIGIMKRKLRDIPEHPLFNEALTLADLRAIQLEDLL